LGEIAGIESKKVGHLLLLWSSKEIKRKIRNRRGLVDTCTRRNLVREKRGGKCKN